MAPHHPGFSVLSGYGDMAIVAIDNFLQSAIIPPEIPSHLISINPLTMGGQYALGKIFSRYCAG